MYHYIGVYVHSQEGVVTLNGSTLRLAQNRRAVQVDRSECFGKILHRLASRNVPDPWDVDCSAAHRGSTYRNATREWNHHQGDSRDIPFTAHAFAGEIARARYMYMHYSAAWASQVKNGGWGWGARECEARVQPIGYTA